MEKFALFFPQRKEKFAPPQKNLSQYFLAFKKKFHPPPSFPTTLLVQFTEKKYITEVLMTKTNLFFMLFKVNKKFEN